MSGSGLTLTLTAGVVYCHFTDGAGTLTGNVLTFTLKFKLQKLKTKRMVNYAVFGIFLVTALSKQ